MTSCECSIRDAQKAYGNHLSSQHLSRLNGRPQGKTHLHQAQPEIFVDIARIVAESSSELLLLRHHVTKPLRGRLADAYFWCTCVRVAYRVCFNLDVLRRWDVCCGLRSSLALRKPEASHATCREVIINPSATT